MLETIDTWVIVVAIIAAVILCCTLSCCCHCAMWKRRIQKRDDALSQIIETPKGPVEVFVKGNAPYMLVFFGTPFTHDGPYGFFDEFFEAGYGIISPARPGYARTPITSGRTYKEQPGLYAAMLDKLGVDKVVVHSISGGGPAAYSFAR